MTESERHQSRKPTVRGTGHSSEDSRAAHDAARGKKVGGKALSSLSKLKLGIDDLKEVLQRINEESDRGAAIMCAALIESLLMELLHLIIANKDETQGLFEDKGAPLATLSNKTVAAYAFGLISRQQRLEIDQIRQVRNAFSHAVKPVDFCTPAIENVCRKLTRLAQQYPNDAYIPWRVGSSRYLFLMASTGLAEELSIHITELAESGLETLRKQFERAMSTRLRSAE
jgi:hypothetical protein